LERHEKKVAGWFGIPPFNVLPSVSYTETERNCGIDLLSYRILDKALQNAIEFRTAIKAKGDELGIPRVQLDPRNSQMIMKASRKAIGLDDDEDDDAS